MAAPLYPLTKGGQPFHCTETQQRAFKVIKQALLSAPALGLPYLTKPFHLYVAKNNGIANRVLMQLLGPWKRKVAYWSQKLDSVAAGWPPCLRLIAAMAQLVKDANKLTSGQQLIVTTSHALENVICQPPDTDGSSFFQDGQRRAGSAVVYDNNII